MRAPALACLALALGLLHGGPAGADPVAGLLRAVEAGDWATAAAHSQRSGGDELASWVTWRRLRSGERLPFEAYRDFLAQHPDWPALGSLRTAAEGSIDASVPHSERLAFFADTPPRTRQGRLRHAESLLAAGREGEAAAAVRLSWVEDDYGVDEEQYALRLFGRLLRPQDHAARLERLLWDGRHDQAERMFPRVDAGRQAVARARIRLQQRLPGVDGAVRAVPAALQDDPGLAFDRLRWRRLGGHMEGARELLLATKGAPVRPASWWYERAYQTREALDARDYRLAYRLASGHGQESGVAFAEAEWLAGWLALRFLDRPETALKHFWTLYDGVSTPISRSRAAYWAGRARAAMGRPGDARIWYERAARHGTTFYGQQAAVELGQAPDVRLASAPVPAARRDAFAKLPLVRLTTRLCVTGITGDAALFLRKLAADAGQDTVALELVADLAAACGRPELVVSIGKAASREGALDPAAAFPVPELPPLDEAGLPETALILAVARQESQFDSQAVSRAGARGLMQLMPGTAKLTAAALGMPYDAAGLTGDPHYNVRLGGAYLASQLARFKGSVPLALAAYNAGPNRVDQWIASFGDPRRLDRHDLIDWLESIPYRETRNYVQRVIESSEVYRVLLRSGDMRRVRFASGKSGASAELRDFLGDAS
ncbi:lytic transglycosylase domain-containing protein [Marinimicrococcus flavescens]|uniref:Lytic transglycosylase domain-containing protein n=1 Tax=Marinimicrococcus flavescens TaxID=3031815 RepID=A0AAP3XQ30_9PROT|nr:lytic transglycosylase domain-containing protein [Marinimicrococcus flavescens]